MKRFLINTIIMLVSLFCLNLAIDYVVTMRLQTSNERRYVGWNDIVHKQLNADMVIMGNSRAYVQYDPRILDSVLGINSYNQSIDGSHLNQDIIKYQISDHYQEKKPQCIIINIESISLEWGEGYEREQYFPYAYLWTPYTRKKIREVEPMSFWELFVPLYRYTTYKGIFALLKESRVNSNLYKGFQGKDLNWDGTEFDKIEDLWFKPDERTLTMLDAFLAERQVEGVQVIFCYAPIYAGVLRKLVNKQEMYDTYQSLADKYGITIMDYSDSYLCSDTAYFYNAMHLNRRGAELFSAQLAHDLDSIGVNELP